MAAPFSVPFQRSAGGRGPMAYVLAPRIARVEATTLPIVDAPEPAVVLVSTGFATGGTGDTHGASQWQVATDTGFGQIVHDTGEVEDDRLTTVVTGLTSGVLYYARVRHRARTLGLSAWSEVIAFEAP